MSVLLGNHAVNGCFSWDGYQARCRKCNHKRDRDGPCSLRAQGLIVEADTMQIFSKDQSNDINTNKERKIL